MQNTEAGCSTGSINKEMHPARRQVVKMATPVSEAIVDQVWEELADMGPSESEGLVQQMQEEQPALLAYLLALEGYGLPQEEYEVILFLGIAVWLMMKRGHPRLMRASIRKLEGAEDANTKFLENMERDEEAGLLSVIENVIDTYPEPAVFRYLLTSLMEPDPEDDVELSGEAIGIGFLHLKTILDALIRSRPK
jgi:hypothetical protein